MGASGVGMGGPPTTVLGSLAVSVMFLAMRDPANGGVAQAVPRVFLGPTDFVVPESSSSSSSSSFSVGRGVAGSNEQCATALENRQEVADSRGGVCPPLAIDANSGCCGGPTKQTVSAEMCRASCSEKACCDSFAKCVVCCHSELRSRLDAAAQNEGGGGGGGGNFHQQDKELVPVSPMHPSMWRKWLLMHDQNSGAGTGVRGDVRGEQFVSGGEDNYRVGPFDYCKHRCRSNSAVTKNENEFQDPKHHCFGGEYVEQRGNQDTLSPGRDSLHDQNGDFKLEGGKSVELGLVPQLNPRSSARHLNQPPSEFFSSTTDFSSTLSDTVRSSEWLMGYTNWVARIFRTYLLGEGSDGAYNSSRVLLSLAMFIVVMIFAMVGVCVCLLRDERLARDIANLLG